jgi:hypothetical protein
MGTTIERKAIVSRMKLSPSTKTNTGSRHQPTVSW